MGIEVDPWLAGRAFPRITGVFVVEFIGGEQSSAVFAFSLGVADVVRLVLGQCFFTVAGLVGGVIL